MALRLRRRYPDPVVTVSRVPLGYLGVPDWALELLGVPGLQKAEDTSEAPGAPKHDYPDPPAGSRWITMHPNGRDAPGHAVLIVPAANKPGVYHVIGGAHGKLNHMEVHLGDPATWKQHSKENEEARRRKAEAGGLDYEETKGGIRKAREEQQREYVGRVAQAMGWNDYKEMTPEDFNALATGDDGKVRKGAAKALAHQYLMTWIKKANEATGGLRKQLAVDHAAAFQAGLTGDRDSSDPYMAEADAMDPTDLLGEAAHYREIGQPEIADLYQRAADAAKKGDYDGAAIEATHARREAGDRNLPVEDMLPRPQRPTGERKSTTTEEAVDDLAQKGQLTPQAIADRAGQTSAEMARATGAGKAPAGYVGKLELEFLDKARAALEKGDMTEAGKLVLQAEKFRSYRERFQADPAAFDAWQKMRESSALTRALVNQAKATGDFGGTAVDPDVSDMSKARALLAARSVYDKRMGLLRQASASMDPKIVHAVVNEADVSEEEWQEAQDAAAKDALAAIERSGEAHVAAELDVAVDDPTAFLHGLGQGFDKDQETVQRYVDYGQRSAADLVGRVVAGAPLLTPAAFRALGVKAGMRLVAQQLASTLKPEEFADARDGIAQYHQARQFDVANGALVAAKASLAAAADFKIEADHTIENLSEAARFNALRLDAVDDALATLGAAYGELNATAELNYALESVAPGKTREAVIDGQGMSGEGLIALAHSLRLEPADYKLVVKQTAEDGTTTPRGLALTPSGVAKMFQRPNPVQQGRYQRLMEIRRGDKDEDGWTPPMFAVRPKDSFEPPPPGTPAVGGEQALEALTSHPKEAVEAAQRALAALPQAAAAFKDLGDCRHAELGLLRQFYLANAGKKAPGEVGPDGKPAKVRKVAPTEQNDVFGQPLGEAAKGAQDARWAKFTEAMHTPEAAYRMIQDVLRGQLTDGFARQFAAVAKQPLKLAEDPLREGEGARATLGPAVEPQMAKLMDRLGPQFVASGGFTPIKDLSMSGKFVMQQRAIRQLMASGGLHGQEGGRLGAFLSPGSGKTSVMIGSFTTALSGGKARQGTFIVPSAVQGQFGEELNSKIDPNSGLTWELGQDQAATDRRRALASEKHVYVTTHQSFRDDGIRAIAEMWGLKQGQATTKFNAMPRDARAEALRNAFHRQGWDRRLDFIGVDEGHQALNREGKENALLANIIDAASDNAKYYVPATGTPVKNDDSEIYDWLSKIRPDEYPPEGRERFRQRHSLLMSQASRDDEFRDRDRATPGGDPKNWTNSAAAEAMQQEVGANFFATQVPITIPVHHHEVSVDLADDLGGLNGTETLPQLMAAGRQRAAYDRVARLEEVVRKARLSNEVTPQVSQALRELTSSLTTGKDGQPVAKNSFILRSGREIAPGTPEEAERTKALMRSVGMLRDAAYNRVIHDTPGESNAKAKKALGIVEELMGQEPADDRQEGTGRPGIIFARGLETVDSLTRTLQARYGKDAVVAISGKDSSGSKTAKKRKFQPDPGKQATAKILVMSDAMSAGIDLPRAEWVMNYDTPDTSKVLEQRNARAVRLSTKHPVDVYRLATTTPYEQRRVKRVKTKAALGDTMQNPAEILDDSGLAAHINHARQARLRQNAAEGAAAHPDHAKEAAPGNPGAAPEQAAA